MSDTSRTVTTQAELDRALADGVATVYVNSPSGVWLRLTSSDSSRVVARDSSRVVARDSSRVVARDSSRVEARDSSRVEARGSSRVEARDSSRVEAWGSSRVVARDSSRVEAWDSSRVVAWDSSRVEARDSSRVVAWGSSSVVAWGSSRVEAGPYVAVHLHSQRVSLEGGVVIDLTVLDLADPAQWADYHGIKKTAEGKALVYKAVDAEGNAGHEYRVTAYAIGSTVTAPDWKPTRSCGQGLHFGITPSHARTYFNGSGEPRFLACEIDAAAFVALDDKCKSQSCVVLFEVDLHGERVAS